MLCTVSGQTNSDNYVCMYVYMYVCMYVCMHALYDKEDNFCLQRRQVVSMAYVPAITAVKVCIVTLFCCCCCCCGLTYVGDKS